MKKLFHKISDKNSSMTSTVLQPQQTIKGWTNDRIRLSLSLKNKKDKLNKNNSNSDNSMSSSDSNGLKKAIMKMLVFDGSNSSNSKNNNKTLANFLSNGGNSKANRSLLKFFAINALELSAPASPALLQQTSTISPGWLQLSGHPKSIAPAAEGVVQKRISTPTDSEVIAYRGICRDVHASQIVPKFLGVREINNESYIELEDLLHGFKDPNVIDIKMGCRTFGESEVSAKILRPDLYKKMIAVDPNAPTDEEHKHQAITKLRYMMFREQLSSSQTKGFRIEALKIKGNSPVTSFKTLKSDDEIQEIISNFVDRKQNIAIEISKCLKNMRHLIEESEFFKHHEVIGSSVFIVYDDEKIGAWLIDFAKCRRLVGNVKVDHRKEWQPGNCEEGLLHGMDELIKSFDSIAKA